MVIEPVSGQPFGNVYAGLYDLVTETKDYELECRVIEKYFAEFSDRPIRHVLDVGCGTGSHALRLAGEDRPVLGIDPSPAMIDRAREKAVDQGANVRFLNSSFQAFTETLVEEANDGAGKFDAVLLMSTVLGYISSDVDIVNGLRRLRPHVRDGAVLLADIWFGPAVVVKGPSTTFRKVEADDRTILRLAEGSFDLASQIYRTTITVWDIVGGELASSSTELHDIRVFFPRELTLLLSSGGFELVGVYGFPDTALTPDSSTWSVLLAARAV